MHIGNFTVLKLPFLRSITIFCLQGTMAESQHWLCLTFLLDWQIDTVAAGPFLIGGAICLVNTNNDRASSLLNTPPIFIGSHHWAWLHQGYWGYRRSIDWSIDWNWTQIKLNSSLSKMNDSGANASMFPIKLLGVKTNPAKTARNLGVIFDTNFTFRSHIPAVCSSCFYHMRDVWRIRCYLDLDSAKLLATALVSSRLNYCNSLVYGITDTDITKLQRVQNRLARIVIVSSIYSQCSTVSFPSLVTS